MNFRLSLKVGLENRTSASREGRHDAFNGSELRGYWRVANRASFSQFGIDLFVLGSWQQEEHDEGQEAPS